MSPTADQLTRAILAELTDLVENMKQAGGNLFTVHGNRALGNVRRVKLLLNEFANKCDREIAAAQRELMIEQTVADVIPIHGRHDVE